MARLARFISFVITGLVPVIPLRLANSVSS
jgi:hypothetical protein